MFLAAHACVAARDPTMALCCIHVPFAQECMHAHPIALMIPTANTLVQIQNLVL